MENNEDKKYENEELSKYALSVVIQKIDSNPDIKAVFGSNFARETLPKHITKILFNHEKDTTAGGDFNIANGVIRLFHKDYKEDVNTKEDLNNNADALSTLIHESVHAMLWHPDKDNIGNAGVKPTGLELTRKDTEGSIETYNNGLNEGFTEWIRRLIDENSSADSYVPQRKAFEIMSLRYGNQKVLSLAKGDILENIKNLLGFKNLDEAHKFILNSDIIFDSCEALRHTQNVVSRLKEEIEKCEESGIPFDAKTFANRNPLNRNYVASYRRANEWIDYASIDKDALMNYMREQENEDISRQSYNLNIFETTLVNRTFGSFTKNLVQAKKVSPYDLKKLVDLYKLIGSQKLKSSIGKVITGKLASNLDKDADLGLLFSITEDPDILNNISNYEMVKIEGDKYDSICLVPKGGSGKVYDLKQRKESKDITERKIEDVILEQDFTQPLGCDSDYTTAIGQFEGYKERFFSKDPNARVLISNRNIIFKSDILPTEYFTIEDGYITQDENVKVYDTTFDKVELQKPARESIFTRARRSIAKLFGKDIDGKDSFYQYYDYFVEDEHEKYVKELQESAANGEEKDPGTIEKNTQKQKEKENKEVDR